MARNKTTSKKTAVPVFQGNVFAAFLREASSIGAEVEARRTHDFEVSEYLKEKGLVDDFNAWKAKRPAQG